nr:hypothetical protein [Tanacetum cinerariifolium]
MFGIVTWRNNGNLNDVLKESFKVVVFVLFSKVGLVGKEVIMRRLEKGSAKKIVVVVKASKEIPKIGCGLGKILGFAAAPAVLKPEHPKADNTRIVTSLILRRISQVTYQELVRCWL